MPLMEKLEVLINQFIGIESTISQIEAFRLFENLLLEWNAKFNLTSITNTEDIYVKHFLDSLTALSAIHSGGDFSIIDIGTGAGFPGIPLKIMLPEISLTLVESSHKKAEFCKHVIKSLKLTNTVVLPVRAEDLGKDPIYRGKYDWAVARAVAKLSIIAEYLLPFVKIAGKALAMKGAETENEILEANHAVSVLGGEISEVVKLNLPTDNGGRTLIVMKKVAPTPNTFPRRAGLPAKNPIK
jgi:16S rRNA (guanine527-N7)-methyltransferase